jgi:hypothetical protein
VAGVRQAKGIVRKAARIAVWVLVASAAGSLLSIEGAYRLTLSTLRPLPSFAPIQPLSPRIARALWAAQFDSEPRPIPRLYPWAVFRYFDRKEKGLSLAWGVARTFLAEARGRGQVRGMLHWHLKGVVVTAWVTRNLDDDQIVARYAERLWFGGSIHGLEAGAHHWFGSDVESLTDPQLALLLGMAENPRIYDPIEHSQRAFEQRRVVLTRFVAAGLMPAATMLAANASPLLDSAPSPR